MITRVLAVLVVCVLSTASLAGAREAWAGQEKLGTVEFPTSCSPEVQPEFNRAVAADEPLRDLVVDHVAALKGRTAIPAGYAPVALAWVAQLPIPALRTDADIAALAEVEHHAVSLTGYVTRVLPVPARVGSRGVTPWEFYLHLRVAPPPACEYHDDPRNVVAVVTPPFQPPHTEWDFDVLADLCGPATRVRVSGWLLYDPFSRPQVGRSRLSPWSIHPVTQLEVWNARDRAWDRLP